MEYYNKHIQIDKKVIDDVFSNIKANTKMLVFGLGYDSMMWYKGNNKNTFFVENNDKYIQLNSKYIPSDKIIKYDYKTNCISSQELTESEIQKFEIPEKILQNAPFDIIIIDGPEGYSPEKPGRLIPCYWSSLISKQGTLIYVDDSSRVLEDFCIKKYFPTNIKQEFSEREKCTKIYF